MSELLNDIERNKDKVTLRQIDTYSILPESMKQFFVWAYPEYVEETYPEVFV